VGGPGTKVVPESVELDKKEKVFSGHGASRGNNAAVGENPQQG